MQNRVQIFVYFINAFSQIFHQSAHRLNFKKSPKHSHKNTNITIYYNTHLHQSPLSSKKAHHLDPISTFIPWTTERRICQHEGINLDKPRAKFVVHYLKRGRGSQRRNKAHRSSQGGEYLERLHSRCVYAIKRTKRHVHGREALASVNECAAGTRVRGSSAEDKHAYPRWSGPSFCAADAHSHAYAYVDSVYTRTWRSVLQ